jgi:Protein of unknown function (DUF3619)
MSSNEMEAADTEFALRAKALLGASADELSGRVRSRLTRARYAALEAARPAPARHWRNWAPAGAVASGVLIALLFVGQQGSAPVSVAANPLDDVELLADADAYELGQEQAQEQDQAQTGDYEFYEWAAGQAEGGSSEPVGT